MTDDRHPARVDDTLQLQSSAPSVRVPSPLELSFAPVVSELAVVRDALRDWLAHTAVGPDQSGDIVLAVSEACSNSIEHAGHADGDRIHLRSMIARNDVIITVRDTGSWKPPVHQPKAFRGQGITMMRALMDVVRITPGSSGTLVEMQSTIRL